MEHYERSSLNYFTARSMDRVSSSRGGVEWLAVRLQDRDTRFVPVWQSKNFFATDNDRDPKPIYLSLGNLQDVGSVVESAVLLGVNGSSAYFAVDVRSEDGSPFVDLTSLGQFQDLRRVASLLSEQDCSLMAHAKAMIHWHHRHRFCGDCGSATRNSEGGYVRVCTNAECGLQHFPRVDPAIIVLVTAGDRCLLGRKPDWRPAQYSTIAGFVEPGESLEAAVAREVQPWPFPSSLMLGFMAEAASETIQVGDDELEDVRWFTREEMRDSLADGTLKLSFHLAISFHLIENWFDAGSLGRLRDIS